MKRLMILSVLVLSTLIIPWQSRAQNASPPENGAVGTAPSQEAVPEDVVTLAKGLQQVMSQSHDVLITQEGELIASADVRTARSGFFPSINGSASHTSLEYQIAGVTNAGAPSVSGPVIANSFPGGTPTIGTLVTGQTTQKIVVAQEPTDFWSFSASVQETLFDFWRTIDLYKASKELFNNSKLDTTRVKNLAALQFTTAYFDLLEAEKVVTVAQQEVSRLEGHRRDAQNLYSAGSITKNDLLQAEVRLVDGTEGLLNANNARALTASRLNNLLVRPLSKPLQVVDIEFEPEPPPFTMDEAWDKALKDRPEMQIVDGTIKALKLTETAKKADYYPTIFVNGGLTYSQNQFLFHQTNYSATLGMNVNLFEGGATQAAVAKIKYQEEQTLRQRNKLEDNIRLEVESYILDLNNARARIDVNKSAADQAQENLRINKVRYDAGEGIATEVLDAVTLLTTAETNYIRAIYDFRRAEAGMYYAVGKDLREVYRQ